MKLIGRSDGGLLVENSSACPLMRISFISNNCLNEEFIVCRYTALVNIAATPSDRDDSSARDPSCEFGEFGGSFVHTRNPEEMLTATMLEIAPNR
jgi:hypothetical protein